MQKMALVKEQLARLGFSGRMLGRGEILELPKMLRPKEKLISLIFGLHKTGTALVAATDQRLLFIDKRFYHCKYDDIPYHMIGNVEDYTGAFYSKVKVAYRGGEINLSKVPKARASLFVNAVEKKIDTR